MAQCYIQNCKRKAKRRFTGGNEAILCTKHWNEVLKETIRIRRGKK